MTDAPKGMADPVKVARALEIARIMLTAHENAITVEWAEGVEDEEVIAQLQWPDYCVQATIEFRQERGDKS